MQRPRHQESEIAKESKPSHKHGGASNDDDASIEFGGTGRACDRAGDIQARTKVTSISVLVVCRIVVGIL